MKPFMITSDVIFCLKIQLFKEHVKNIYFMRTVAVYYAVNRFCVRE